MPLAGAAGNVCAVFSVAVVIPIPDAVPQRLKPPPERGSCGTSSSKTTQRLLRYRRGNRLRALLLFLPVADRGADGVLGQHGTMDLHRRKRKLLHDVHVLDGESFIHSFALDPPRGQ